VLLGGFVGCELASAALVLPLGMAFDGFFGQSMVVTPQCVVPLACKMLLLLLGSGCPLVTLGEIEKSLWAYPIEKL
jgi:hypothetical protein